MANKHDTFLAKLEAIGVEPEGTGWELWTPLERAVLVTMWPRGFSLDQVMVALGPNKHTMTQGTIYYQLRRLRIGRKTARPELLDELGVTQAEVLAHIRKHLGNGKGKAS